MMRFATRLRYVVTAVCNTGYNRTSIHESVYRTALPLPDETTLPAAIKRCNSRWVLRERHLKRVEDGRAGAVDLFGPGGLEGAV